MSPYFFIFGFGYTAEYLTAKLSLCDISIVGTKRIIEAHQEQKDYKPIAFAHAETYLRKAQYILISIPPIEGRGDIVLAEYGVFIKNLAPQLKWLGYLSSTSVYGDHQGQWVDEHSLCRPTKKQGIARLSAEQAWMDFSQKHQLPLHIFRLAGIYGPNRNALSRILGGKNHSIYKKDHYFSRIHVDDLVSVLIASMKAPKPFSIYNLADDKPERSDKVDSYAATLLKRAPLVKIPFNEAALSLMEKEFYTDNRRISNVKIKSELGIQLKYPSFREGLDALRKNISF